MKKKIALWISFYEIQNVHFLLLLLLVVAAAALVVCLFLLTYSLQTGLKLIEISGSQVMGLNVCSTTLGYSSNS